MRIIKQIVDLYSDQIIRGIKSFLGKINIQTSNSSRTYYLEAGADNEYPINSDPGGSFRATEFELRFKSFIPTLTRDGYGSNIKCILSTNADSNNLRTLSGNYYAANFYSNLLTPYTTVNRIAAVNALADVGSNLTGTTVTNLTSVLARGVAARSNTVVTNAHAIYAESPKHGVNRYAGLFEETTGGSGENFSIKALGDCRFEKTISVNGKKITYGNIEPTNPEPYDIWYETGNTLTTLTTSAQIKQIWYRSAESNPASRKWVSANLYYKDVKIKDGTLSTNQSVPVWFNSEYKVLLSKVLIQAFVSSGDLTTNSWTIFLQNTYGVAATEITSFSFNGDDSGAGFGSSIRKTLRNSQATESTPAFNTVSNELWIYIFRPGNNNAPDLVEPTMFFEYRFIRP